MKRFIFIILSLLLISCSNNNSNEKIDKIISQGNFSKAERLIKSDSFTESEKEMYGNIIFNKKLEIAVDEAFKGDWKNLNKMIKKGNLSQEQYDMLLSSIYTWVRDIQVIMEKTNYLIPLDSYCANRTILELAVKEQKYDLIKILIEKGADLQLTDKEGQYNPLLLSIEFTTENSLKIFKLLLDNTIINSQYFKRNNYSSEWYVEKMIQCKQPEMLKLFFENSKATQAFLNTEECLQEICTYSHIFDYCDESLLLNVKNIDENYDYFLSALESCNPEAVKLLMKMNVSPIMKGEDAVDIFFDSCTRVNGGIAWPALSTGKYEELLELKPEIDEYVKKWIVSQS